MTDERRVRKDDRRASSSEYPTGPKTYKILVIEDDEFTDWPLIRRALNRSSSCKFEYTHQTHLHNALIAIRHRHYDAILLDLHLQWDGPANPFDVVKTVVGEAPDTPIIVLSSTRDIDVAVQTIGNGASAYIEKPPHPRRLESVLCQAIERNINEEVLRRLMHESLTKYSAEDSPVLAPLIGSHLDNIEAGLKHLRAYLEGLSKEALIEFDKILGYSHVAISTREIRKILKLEEQRDRPTTPPPSAVGNQELSPEVLNMSLAHATTRSEKRRRTITERAISDLKQKALSHGRDGIKTEADARKYLLAVQSRPPAETYDE